MSITKTYCPKAFNTIYFDGLMAGPCCIYLNPVEQKKCFLRMFLKCLIVV